MTAPTESALYPELAAESVMAVRMKLGMSSISFNYRKILGALTTTLIVDFFNNKGKLYTLGYILPADTIDRTESRVSLLLQLIKKNLTETL